MRNRGKTISELAGEAGVGGSYFTRILRRSFLAPDVVKTILRDRHPIELTAKKLASDTRLPVAWEERIDGRVQRPAIRCEIERLHWEKWS